ncbi:MULTISPECIES: tape measure protein [unclassified Neisseria]|uniref:tape measure protein n=1 Tax=unclassified Neisseria TaxID=2623750 RepID=UPI001072C52F|nr:MULTISPECIES: tape measure protein [unclassified Neisseria]MBF0803361.1 tape measure protein [Neisseria sp. 19428wB4_WF04]TFU44023.1 hypothetical protein E4T99_03165 [Neisseria sp. WF04]
MAKSNTIEAGLRISAGVEGLDEVKKLSDELQATGADTKGLTGKFAELQKEFGEIGKQQAVIENFKGIKRAFKETDTAILATKQSLNKLKAEMDGDGTKAQQKRYADLQGEINRLNGKKRSLGTQLKKVREEMNAAGITANTLSQREKELAAQSDAARAKMTALGGEMGKLKAKAAAAAADTGKLNTSLKPISQSIAGMGSSMAAVAGVGGGLYALKQGLTAVIDTTTEFKAIRSRMEYAFGGATQAAEQMDWVKEVANELGLELKSVANGYAQLSSATKNIGLSTEKTQQIFKGVASAAASMNLSTEETNGVLLALSQIAGKGKVSMEELRGQLGERLTPAMAIAAKSMGVTTAELEKMVESGIAAEDFLPKFGAAMEEAFGGAESAGAAVNRLKNQFDEMLLKIGEEGGIADAYNKIIGEVGDALSWVQEKIEGLDGALTGGVSDAFFSTYELIKEGAAEIGDAFGGLVDIVNEVGGAFATILGADAEQDFDLIKGIIDGINISLGALRDGVAGIGILFDTFAGTALSALGKVAQGLGDLNFLGLGEEYEQAAAQMAAAAEKHLTKAHEAALAFESKTAQAVERAMETESQRYARLEAEARTTYDKAAQAAIDAAEAAKQAQQRAEQAIGTSQETVTRKAADEAEKTAAAARKAALSAEKDWEKAFTKMGGSAEDLAALKKPLAEIGGEAKKAAGEIEKIADQAKIVPSKVAEAFAKIGVDAEAATTGISSKAKEAFADWQAASAAAKDAGIEDARLIRNGFEQMMGKLQSRAEFEAFRAQLQKSGDAAVLTKEQIQRLNDAAKEGAAGAKTAYDAMAESIKTAAAAADLSRVAAEAKAAFEAGAITAAQYDQVLAQVKQRTAELEAQSAKAGDTAANAHNKAAAAADNHARAAQGAGKSNKELADGMEKVAGASESATRKVNALHQGISSTYGVVKLTREEFVRYNNLLHGLTEQGTHFLRKGWRAYADQFLNSIKDANRAQEELNAAISDGTVNMGHLIRATTAAGAAAGKLDKTSLANLQNSIEAARQKLVQLKDEATDARLSIEAELAAINGDEEAGYALQQQRKLAELRAKQQAAAKNGQGDVAGEWARALQAQETLYARQKEQRQREKAEEEQRQREAAASNKDGGSRLNLGNLDNLKLDGLGDAASSVIKQLESALNARDAKVVEKAGQELLVQLQAGLHRMS